MTDVADEADSRTRRFEMSGPPSPEDLLQIALEEARKGLAEGGAPIGAALVADDGTVLGTGRNRVVQDGDFLLHAEICAIRAGGSLSDYRDTTLVTTLVPCWYCAGLVRFLGIGRVVAGDCSTWSDEALGWLAGAGVRTVALGDQSCVDLMGEWIGTGPSAWKAMPSSVDGARPR